MVHAMTISLDTIVTILSILSGVGGPLFFFLKRFLKSVDVIGDKLEVITNRITELEKQYAVAESKLMDARAAKQDLDELRRNQVVLESKLQAAFRIIDQLNPMRK